MKQLIINPAKAEIVETKVIQQAEPETYTVTMNKDQMMFFVMCQANMTPSDNESLGYEFYEECIKTNKEFKKIGEYQNDLDKALNDLKAVYRSKLKSLGLDS